MAVYLHHPSAAIVEVVLYTGKVLVCQLGERDAFCGKLCVQRDWSDVAEAEEQRDTTVYS
jgi:hypothetical protein